MEPAPPTGPLFPPWSTTVLRAGLGLICLALVAAPSLLWAWERTPYVSGEQDPKPQPIKFDHRHHVRDDGISCFYCHTDARRAATAGMPAASICMGCHAQVWKDSDELEPLREAYFSGAGLAWERVTRLPDFVFFDHSIHIAKGVGCVTCHGRVDLMAQVYAVKPFTMHFCLDCHRAPEAFLRPPSRVADMEWPAASPSERQGPRLRSQLHVHPKTDCTTCHR